MLLLTFLMLYRSWLTPEFLHLVSAVEDDEAHCVFIMLLWLCYRCFLEPDIQVSKAMTAEKVWDERLKVFARCSLEFNVTMMALTATVESSVWPWTYCTGVLLLFAARSVVREWLDLPFLIMLVAYFVQNLIVNVIDLAFFKHSLKFETDEALVNLFSYKLW